jgi:hypothetical protein
LDSDGVRLVAEGNLFLNNTSLKGCSIYVEVKSLKAINLTIKHLTSCKNKAVKIISNLVSINNKLELRSCNIEIAADIEWISFAAA